jgi:hypothetical protein
VPIRQDIKETLSGLVSFFSYFQSGWVAIWTSAVIGWLQNKARQNETKQKNKFPKEWITNINRICLKQA